MRCKKDQRAWISKSCDPAQIGVVVKIEGHDPDASIWAQTHMWQVTFSGVVIGVSGKPCYGVGVIADDCLTPINDPGLADEVTTDELIESGVTA